jgi:penicillin amidase
MKSTRGWSLWWVVLVAFFLSGCAGWNSYQHKGQLQLAGLRQPVKVLRDEKGMAYIYAANLEDAIMAQGFVCAQDRLFQMELTRLFATGRISELVGAKAVPLDTRMRTLGFYRHAKEKIQRMDVQSLRYVKKYIDGVNAFIKTRADSRHMEFKLAGIEPTPWSPADSLAIGYYMSWDSSANLSTEIVAQMLVDRLGVEKARQIFPLNINPDDPIRETAQGTPRTAAALEQGIASDNRIMGYLQPRPMQIGSNNWAVAAEGSAGGKPIFANDPHLDARILPGPWYPCGIITPGLRAVGVSPAGIPGLVIFRNENVAVGITNAYGDTQDLYLETVDPDNADHYMQGGQSIPFKVIEETLRIKDKKAAGGLRQQQIKIRFTRRGPVISGLFPDFKTDKVFAMRWALVEKIGPQLGLDKIMQAQSVADVREALKHLDMLLLNYTFADTQGNIGWQVSGNLPIRSQGEATLPYEVTDSRDNWIGWIPFDEMPQLYNPPRGWVGTCNHNTIPADYPYYYSSHLASSYRYRRLKQLLDTPGVKSADDHWQFQRDTLNLMAVAIAPVMAKALTAHADTRQMGRILSEWDFHDDPGLAAPTIFQAVYRQFALLVFEDELGDELAATMLSDWYFWQERLGEMVADGQSSWFDDVKTPDVKETRDPLFHQAALKAAADLKARIGGDPTKWRWGRVHRIEFVSPIRREGFGKSLVGGGSHPAIGSCETLGRGIYAFNKPFDVVVFASLRMVADLSDTDKVLAVLPGGVAGRLFDPHTTDQIESYINGDKVYWWFSDDAIKEHSRHSLVLEP